jgi:monofunctional biosynthetic peptidoglycan transglycosylase
MTAGRVARLLAIALLLPITGFISWLWLSMPDVKEFAREFPDKTSFMTYRDLQYEGKGEKVKDDYRPIPLRQISSYLKSSVIASEDASFYSHNGFDYDEIQEAIEENIEKGEYSRGASTISQQLAKNLYLTPEKSIVRKVREMAITKRLEEGLSKDRILELYLNVAEWGRGIYGCEAASHRYFSKGCSDLSPREAALLAAALPSPRKFNPASKESRAYRRQQKIIHWLCLGKKIPENECLGERQ